MIKTLYNRLYLPLERGYNISLSESSSREELDNHYPYLAPGSSIQAPKIKKCKLKACFDKVDTVPF